MANIKKKLLLFTKVCLILLISTIITVQEASAHAGGGPPFVKVNGEYALTNPLFQGNVNEKGLEIPQDITKSLYTINTPITLDVEIDKLGLSPENTEQVEFIWTFSKGDNFQHKVHKPLTGEHVTTSFSNVGSYLITVESRQDGMTTILLDTILIHVVPTLPYSLPKSGIAVSTSYKSGTPSVFTNTSSIENAKYLWDFDENTAESGKSVSKTFTLDYFFTPVIARLVDDQGLVIDTGVIVVGDKGQLSFSPLDQNADPGQLKVVQKNPPLLQYWYIFAMVAGIIVASVLFFWLKKAELDKK